MDYGELIKMTLKTEVTIRTAYNGYIVTTYIPEKENVFKTLEEVFDYLLIHLEGKSPTFKGESYGKVTIEYGKKEND